ncbi:MAG: HAD hydrolase-like protein, partial [Gammaproteobacteria bacterium]|nr:HAD hydrolase-like protein [Gammaproteobacteria bacterium]
LGVCTSKFEKYAIKILQEFELDKYFEFVSGCGNYEMTKSDQLRELLGKDIVKQNSLMIGDRDIDLISARQTGLSSAGVLWGYGSSEELAKEKPAFIVDTPAQLTAALIDRM